MIRSWKKNGNVSSGKPMRKLDCNKVKIKRELLKKRHLKKDI